MNRKEMAKAAELLFSSNRVGRMAKMVENALRMVGFSDFIDVMEKYRYKITFVKKISPKLGITVTDHARERASSYLAKEFLTNQDMKNMLLKGQSIPYADLLARGFRPGYHKRLKEGRESIYVDMADGLIAVLSIDTDGESLIWITTLSESRTPTRWRIPITEEEYRKFVPEKERSKHKTKQSRNFK